jgi:hypothetical protein
MNDGYWINFSKGQVFSIDEHERWIRRSDNAKKLGVPQRIQKKFAEFNPVVDREKFLLLVLTTSPAMRVRGHGIWWAFEFSSASVEKPLTAIYSFCNDKAGAYTNLVINNFARKNSISMLWKDFKGKYETDDARLREARIMEGAQPMVLLPIFDEYLQNCNQP